MLLHAFAEPRSEWELQCVSIFFFWFFLVRALGGFRRVAAAVIVQFLVGNFVVSVRGVISIRGEFAAETGRTDVGAVLVARAPAIEGRIGNRQCKFAGLVPGFAHGKSVLAHKRADFVPDKLDDEAIAHTATAVLGPMTATAGMRAPAATFFLRLERERLGGVPSAGSTIIMLVTNFFRPCRSKSIDVRSASESVTTPNPY